MLGSDLTQADIDADYSCVAVDTISPSVKITTDGENQFDIQSIYSFVFIINYVYYYFV